MPKRQADGEENSQAGILEASNSSVTGALTQDGQKKLVAEHSSDGKSTKSV